jgi:ERF superfamily
MGATAQPRSRARAAQPEPEAPLAAVAQLPVRDGQQLELALLAFQKAAPALTRNARGQIGSRQYGYTSLDRIHDDIKPLMQECGLTWRAMPCFGPSGEPALRYRLTHAPSGEFDEDVMPLMLEHPDPQGQGSAITYARRYAMICTLDIVADADDDGAAATPRNQPPAPGEPQPAPTPTARPGRGGDRPASVKQKNMLRAKARAAELAAVRFAEILNAAGGGEPRKWDDEDAAKQWIERALDRLPARLVDAVVEGIATDPPF